MRRIIMILTFAALMALTMALAGPASAQVPPPPNCEHGQLTAALHSQQKVKHAAMAAACLAGIPPGHAQQALP